jgi:hypothetical protein
VSNDNRADLCDPVCCRHAGGDGVLQGHHGQIRKALEGLLRVGAPVETLTRCQVTARCARWLRMRGLLDNEIPSPTSFERHLPGLLAEVLVGSTSSIG